MVLNLDNKEKAYGTLFFIALVSLAFWWYSDTYSLWSGTANPWIAVLLMMVLNPSYAILIYILFKEYGNRGICAGLLISLAVDIASLPHSITMMGTLPGAGPLYAYSDTLFGKMVLSSLQGKTGTFVLYVIIPVALIYLALRIIRRTSSFNKIMKESI